MKFLLAPKLYLISQPLADRYEINRFLIDNGFATGFEMQHDTDAEQLSATGSRTCYQSFENGRAPDEHLKHLVEVGHGSVFTHANFTVLATGISRSLTHELIRHHVGTGVSQLSQRFVDDPKELNFVVPPALAAAWGKEVGAEFAIYTFSESCRQALNAYTQLLAHWRDRKLPKKQAAEAARSVLPNATETRIVFTANVRAWRNIWEQRCQESADAEIRRFACATYELIYPHIPTICDDYTRTNLPDGTFSLHTDHRKI